MGRKIVLLLVTSFATERPYLANSLQLLVLTYSMWMQRTEHPFAELGSARKAFVEAHPDGNGWSRGDNLEMLSLATQAVNVLLTFLCALIGGTVSYDGTRLLTSGVSNAVGAVMVVVVLLPAGYAVHIFKTEWAAGRQEVQVTTTASAEARTSATAAPASDTGLEESSVEYETVTTNPVAPATYAT